MLRGMKIALPGREPNKISAELKANIHNRFDIEVIDTRTGKVRQRAQAENVICSQLWMRLLSPNAYFSYIFYGTGTGTPAATDTALFMHLGYGTPSASDDVYNVNREVGYCSLTRKIQLSETTAVGSALTEVGVAYGTTSTNLVTHAMLKDMNGNTITITKTATDIINIYATVFVHWNTSGYGSGNIKMICTDVAHTSLSEGVYEFLLGLGTSGITYRTRGGLRIYLTPGWNGIFRGGEDAYIETSAAGGGYDSSSPTVTCSVANKTITFAITRLAVASGNIGGIKTALIGRYRSAYSSYAPSSATETFLPIVQIDLGSTSIAGESLGTGDASTVDFTTAFPFAHDATVYVNGVQASGVTVENIPSKLTRMELYFQLIEATNYAPPVVNCYGGHGSYNTRTPGYTVYYNPNWALGISSFTKGNGTSFKVFVSDDLTSWTEISGTTVSAELQKSKFWKLVSTLTADTTGYSDGIKNLICARSATPNVHFTTAPAAGDTLTIDYTTDTIAKDQNHVFDFSMTIQLGEYTA